MQRVVIIGAGQAAIWAIKTLRSEGYTGQITVIGDEEDSFYERPPLSKEMLIGEADYNALKIFSDDIVKTFDIELVTPVRATRIDRENQCVYTNTDKVFTYDKLLIATGSQANIPVKEWTQHAHVYTLRNIKDNKSIRSKIQTVKHAAIIGGGWIGLEVAASLRSLGMNVSIYEMSERLCARSVSKEVSDFLLNLHREQGVNIHLSCRNIDLISSDDAQKVIVKTDQHTHTFDAVILGTGAYINKDIAVESGIQAKDAIVVDEYCRTNDPDIYAAGDVAIHPKLGFSAQSWANAQNQGVIAAKSMLSLNQPYEDIPWLWSDQYDKNIQILGSPLNIDHYQLVFREESDNSCCFFYLDKENKLQYLVAVNHNKAIKIAKRWMKANLSLNIEQLQDISFNILKIK